MFSAKTTTVKFEKGEDVAGAEASTQETKIMVDVDGQVLKPGLYSLKSNARVQDALIAAGGLSSNADRNAINLAAKISDGQKIYIPEIGEKPSAVTVANSTSVTSLNRATGLLSVNTASQSELEDLPSIGPVTAQKIISGRPYGTIEELLSKKVVGEKTFEKIKDLISL